MQAIGSRSLRNPTLCRWSRFSRLTGSPRIIGWIRFSWTLSFLVLSSSTPGSWFTSITRNRLVHAETRSPTLALRHHSNFRSSIHCPTRAHIELLSLLQSPLLSSFLARRRKGLGHAAARIPASAVLFLDHLDIFPTAQYWIAIHSCSFLIDPPFSRAKAVLQAAELKISPRPGHSFPSVRLRDLQLLRALRACVLQNFKISQSPLRAYAGVFAGSCATHQKLPAYPIFISLSPLRAYAGSFAGSCATHPNFPAHTQFISPSPLRAFASLFAESCATHPNLPAQAKFISLSPLRAYARSFARRLKQQQPCIVCITYTNDTSTNLDERPTGCPGCLNAASAYNILGGCRGYRPRP